MARKKNNVDKDEPVKENPLAATSAEVESAAAKDNYERMMNRIKTDVWGYGEKGALALKANMQMLSMKHGICSRIPIFCKGDNCPYEQSCITSAEGLAPVGQACPVEVAMISRKIKDYTEEFDLDQSYSPVDEALVEEIILMEVSMERCQALMSQESSPIQQMVIGMSEDGTPIYQPQVAKSVEAYERFSKKRNEDYSLLVATRKDKKGTKSEENKQDIFSIIDQAQHTEGFYDIEQRPDDLNIDDAETTDK